VEIEASFGLMLRDFDLFEARLVWRNFEIQHFETTNEKRKG
jgi:hypothetical protein